MRTRSTLTLGVLLAAACLGAHGRRGDPTPALPLERGGSLKDDSGSLLAKSVKVGAWTGTLGADATYWWLTDDKVMYFEHVPQPVSAAQRKLMGVPDDFAPGHFKAFILDITTNKRTAFGAFNTCIGNTIDAQPMEMSFNGGPPTETKYLMPSSAISPDRTWFVWKSNSGCHAAKLDGTKRLDEQTDFTQVYVCFLPGRKWAELESNCPQGQWIFTNVIVHGLESTADRKVAVNQPANGILVGATPAGDLLSIDYVNEMQTPCSTVPVDEYNISGSTAKTSHYTVTLPGNYRVWSATLSNGCDRIAWVVSDGNAYRLAVTDVMGKHWTDLGEVDRADPAAAGSGGTVSWPQGVAWLPDDRDLSFVFNGNLYRIPAPPRG